MRVVLAMLFVEVVLVNRRRGVLVGGERSHSGRGRAEGVRGADVRVCKGSEEGGLEKTRDDSRRRGREERDGGDKWWNKV